MKRRRRHGDDARPCPWSDIPPDVICDVLRRLTVRDFVRCGAVCASWRSAMLQRQCRPMLEPPWVIPSRYGGIRGVACSPVGRVGTMPSMPWEMIRSSKYLGSSNGWVGLERVESVHILHALSGAVLRLPDLTTIPGVEAIITDYKGSLRSKIFPFFYSIFIVPPPAGGDRDQLTVLAVCPLMKRLLFARPGDVAWSFVDMPAPLSNFIISLTGHRGSVYAMDNCGRVAVWDYCCSCSSGGAADADALASGPRFTRIVISSGPPPRLRPSALLGSRHLVEEANGDLLQLQEEIEVTGGGLYKTVRVGVFRLEQPGGSEGKGKVGWRRLQHLGHGGTSIFVGRGFSAAFTCRDFPWLERNCIYFWAEFGYPVPRGLHCSPTDGGVYNLRTRKMRAFPSNHRWLLGHWFIPALRSPAAGPLRLEPS